MINKKTGLVLSHMHVREGEKYKFDMLNYVIDNMKEHFGRIVLSGHGIRPEKHILDKVQGIYWEDNIDTREIGVGHPKFCIEAFQNMHDNGIQNLVKLRYCDLLKNIDGLQYLMGRYKDKIIVSEQTSTKSGMIGDLFMAGNTKDVLELWTAKPWDYKKSGLFNLFDSVYLGANKADLDMDEYMSRIMFYVHPRDIMWATLEGSWDAANRKPSQKIDESCLWGAKQGYNYYGGF